MWSFVEEVEVSGAPSFAGLGVGPPLLEGLALLGFTGPTPIQQAALPPLLAGRDLRGRARTGSGKTAAFGLPLLQELNLDDRRVQALVVCPTRELAVQVTGELRSLGKRLPRLRVVPVTGGVPGHHQARTLAEGAHVVVGTPGRLLDHVRRETLDLRAVRRLVLDEADRLLELGFSAELTALREALPAARRTALFSATFPPQVDALSAGWLTDPVVVEVDEAGPELVEQAMVVEEGGRDDALHRLLGALDPASALVFCNLKRTVTEVAQALKEAGTDAEALHGDLEQQDRDRLLAALRNGSLRVLVASDVAARGLDVHGLDLVVNRDLPDQPEVYVHRVGRTGRAGRPGLAITLVVGDEAEDLRRQRPVSFVPVPPAGAPLRALWATVRLAAGRSDKLRPGDVLGALAKEVGLPPEAVGRIEIHERHAFVAVARGSVTDAVRGLARHGVKGRRMRVERVS